MFACGKGILYLMMGINLPSLPTSILYLHVFVLWLLFGFNDVIVTDLMLWKLKIFDHVQLLFCHLSFLSILVHVITWYAFFSVAISWHLSALAFTHLLKINSSATSSTFHTIDRTSVWFVYLTAVSTVTLFHLSAYFLCCLWHCSVAYDFYHIILFAFYCCM